MPKRGFNHSDVVKKKISDSLKKAASEGRLTLPSRECIEKGLKAAQTPEARRKAAISRSIAMKGMPKRLSSPTGAHENNQFAKTWWLISPDKKHYRFKNLNEFLRKNAHLFDPKDINWQKSGCNAGRGLRSLFYVNKEGNPLTHYWKGWTIGDKDILV